ncbi:hypothetical protein AYI69_g5616 [Smittium culicis]|uniref:Uncharacterized protein n=1 Tax=Smittium culicis TaxID=133412 RepID=A0A1R1Y4L5_9FUNG|nr:hypothetical protein AYI69_g5616 [Smittium culicis]
MAEYICQPAMELNFAENSEDNTRTTDSKTTDPDMEARNLVHGFGGAIGISSITPIEQTPKLDFIENNRREIKEKGLSDLAIELFVSKERFLERRSR